MPGPVIPVKGGLTPFFLRNDLLHGMIHSCFDRVVNLSFPVKEGPPRLLTLTREDIPPLPDSLRVPAPVLAWLREAGRGVPVTWQRGELHLPAFTLSCDMNASALSPFHSPKMTRERAEIFLSHYAQLKKSNGFADLPEARRLWAMDGIADFANALLTGQKNEKKWPIGLGKGTTPAGDDAIVGVLSIFGWNCSLLTPALLDRTTDISARYLRCAQEGYFSAPVQRVVQELSLAAMEELAQFGATSGADMLLGMAVACKYYLNEEENSMNVKNEIASRKLIAIVRGLPGEQLEGLANALLAGGITLMEITFNQQKPETWSQTADGIRMLCEKFAGKIIAGAGTVVTQEQLTMAYEAGAKYIISPNTDEDIIRRTKELGLVSLPGAMTPSEIVVAHKAGADFVKVFPVGNLGPAYIKAIKAPLSHIQMMAVGGVNEKNADDFMRAGASGLGVGGNLVNKEWIANGEWDKITALAAEYVKAVQ
ncbi:MAG: bifunctional 4-hydroxy-2-oxoglutarate aldolase/2-dehydro-3-deoxy-phosphogluconate aldolase [Clostridiales bacterium]|nr:bifunctional 4-hydroxy-2-oxoglutarate aldolase/2-dehydro-3-deoxy-phosphogluconate aldolase [Clostridiales bacterium]